MPPLIATGIVQAGYGTMVALVIFILASMWIGLMANRAIKKSEFLKGFFLGNRGLGAWTLALTATVQSGGTFVGFPSLGYTFGWSIALWIAGYMVVPIAGFGLIGKRLAQLSRRTEAITVPDLFRKRYGSAQLGLLASIFIMIFMSAMMVAQFKAGALIMQNAWPGGAMILSEQLPAYQLTPESLGKLDSQGGIDKELIARLAPFAESRKGFGSFEEFSTAALEVVGESDWKMHGGKIIKVAKQTFDPRFLFGLLIFTVTVVGYTLIGGFLAAVWTDLFQSVMMLIGVLILLVATLIKVGGIEAITQGSVANTSPAYAALPGYVASGDPREFLPLGFAFSIFCVWVFAGFGSPAGMVRIMACRNTETIRKSIYLLSVYNLFIYIPLILIALGGRVLMPELPPGSGSDEAIPRLALLTTQDWPLGDFVAGLILAAPFGAIMATVSSYLVVIASGLVRDVFQQWMNPNASDKTLRRVSTIVMVSIGVLAILTNIKPLPYLQIMVVFSGSGSAATFCVPAIMTAYWRKATAAGVAAAMIAGSGTLILLYAVGSNTPDQMIGEPSPIRPYFLFGIHPVVWGLLASAVSGVIVSLIGPPPEPERIAWLFDAPKRSPIDRTVSL